MSAVPRKPVTPLVFGPSPQSPKGTFMAPRADSLPTSLFALLMETDSKPLARPAPPKVESARVLPGEVLNGPPDPPRDGRGEPQKKS